MASYHCIDTSKFYCVGLEVNANHLRGLRSGRVTGVCRPVHLGRSTHVWDIRLSGEDGKPSCISRLTVAIVPLGRAAYRADRRRAGQCGLLIGLNALHSAGLWRLPLAEGCQTMRAQSVRHLQFMSQPIFFAHANGFPRRPIASCSRPLRRNTGSRTWIGTDMIRVSRWTITGTTCSTSCSSSSKACANRCGVGHSFGGMLHYRAALLRPELYQGVVMLDSPLPTGSTRPSSGCQAAGLHRPADPGRPHARTPGTVLQRRGSARLFRRQGAVPQLRSRMPRPTSNTGWSRRGRGCACASIRRPKSASTAACRTSRPAGRPR